MKSNELITSIYDKNLEIHYNKIVFRNKENQQVKLELQGKIKCPALNCNISSIVCSSLMDRTGWPRSIDSEICKKCNCFISVSINKFKTIKSGGKDDTRRTTKSS